MIFGFYSKTSKDQEIISRTLNSSRLSAAHYFAGRKQLPLKEFLKVFGVKNIL